jgi:nucleoside-diphosphate-sugar epimerase
MKRILVTGGTGFVGAYLLHYLLQRGYTAIRAIKRANSSMALVKDIEQQIEWIEGDILDIFSLEDAMEGVEQVYHCAAVVSYDPRDKKKLHEVNVKGTANVVNAALHVGIEKLLHVSSIAALGRSQKTVYLDETATWENSKSNSYYAITKYLAEMEVWRGMAEGLTVAVINPSVILGSGFWGQGTSKFFMNGWKNFDFYSTGGTGFVDVRDVAKACIDLMESHLSNQRLIVNAENLLYQELQYQIADALNKKRPTVKVNYIIRELAWRAAWLQSRLMGTSPFITKETARQATKRYYYDNSKSIEKLQVQYTPIKETIAMSCKQLKEAATQDFKPMLLPII